ncbi:unnamed protein product [Prunus armeniaca]
MPDEIKTKARGQLSMNYNLEDLDDESLAYVNRLFAEKSLFRRVARRSLKGERIVGRGSADKAKVNKGNRNKKTLLHHLGSRPFSYRMDARRRGGSKGLNKEA